MYVSNSAFVVDIIFKIYILNYNLGGEDLKEAFEQVGDFYSLYCITEL